MEQIENNEQIEIEEYICVICFDDLDNNKKILTCGHTFHNNCIDTWTKINPICPYCRKYIKNSFNCNLKTKYISKKCIIFIDETKFSKIIIEIYPLLGGKTTKYIIPTTFVQYIETKNNICNFYFKKTNNSKINKYILKFNDKNISSIFSYEINNLFKKYLDFYKSIQNINQ